MRRWWSCALLLLAVGCRDAHPRSQTGEPSQPQPHPSGGMQPHADYPTPNLAGSEELFLRGEPARGPHVTHVTLPDRAALKLSEHAFCELAFTRLPCSDAKPRQGAARWNVGHSGDRVVLAESIRTDGAVAQTYFFDWDPQGRLLRLVSLDSRGTLVWARSFTQPGERYVERTLTGANGLSGCGAIGVKNDHGRLTEADCLQWTGGPMNDTNGVAVTQVRYNGDGFPVETSRLGADHKPILGHDGVHRVVFQRDANGRVQAELFYDLAGKPAMSSSEGCTGKRFDYDDRGVETKETCLGKDGEPAHSDEGVAVTVLESNEAGCVVGRRYLDRDGKPTHIHGVYGMKSTVDEHCDEASSTCIGMDLEPVVCGPEEPATYEYERDEHGRVTSMKHRDPDGDPGKDSEFQVFELRKEWGPLGNLIGQSCWGASGEQVDCNHTGYHAEKIKVDDAGRTREVRYEAIDGTAATNLGVAIRRYRYDNYDHIMEIDGFDADGNAVESMGMAAQRRLYDPAHRLFALLLLDREGKPARYTGCFVGRDCPTRDWHAVRIFRGPNGHVTRNEYFNADGQLLETMDCDTHRCWQ